MDEEKATVKSMRDKEGAHRGEISKIFDRHSFLVIRHLRATVRQ